MYHIFYIQYSVNGQFDCLYVLAIVNSVAVNIGMYVSFLIMYFSRYTPGRGGGLTADSLQWTVVGAAEFVVSKGEDLTPRPKTVSVTQNFV